MLKASVRAGTLVKLLRRRPHLTMSRGFTALSDAQMRSMLRGAYDYYDRPDRVEARGGYCFGDGGWDDSESECYECGGEGCPECNSDYEESEVEFKQCCGITQRGTRCQISTDSIHSHQRKFADAAERLADGHDYCGMHADQEYEDMECPECDGEGCPECCGFCNGLGCEECCPEDYPEEEEEDREAAPQQVADDDEVVFVGSRSRKERDDELRSHAIDVENESQQLRDEKKKKKKLPAPSTKWTAQEEEQLKQAVVTLGVNAWSQVAAVLGTRRSATAVEKRWRGLCGGGSSSDGRGAAAVVPPAPAPSAATRGKKRAAASVLEQVVDEPRRVRARSTAVKKE